MTTDDPTMKGPLTLLVSQACIGCEGYIEPSEQAFLLEYTQQPELTEYVHMRCATRYLKRYRAEGAGWPYIKIVTDCHLKEAACT